MSRPSDDRQHGARDLMRQLRVRFRRYVPVFGPANDCDRAPDRAELAAVAGIGQQPFICRTATAAAIALPIAAKTSHSARS